MSTPAAPATLALNYTPATQPQPTDTNTLTGDNEMDTESPHKHSDTENMDTYAPDYTSHHPLHDPALSPSG